jgi:hypothetical protein
MYMRAYVVKNYAQCTSSTKVFIKTKIHNYQYTSKHYREMTKTANENKTHNLGKLRFTTGNECAVQEKSRLSTCAKQNCDHNYLTHAQKRCNELCVVTN